jgi:hypothetical protein
MQPSLQDLAQYLPMAAELSVPFRLPHIHPDDLRLMINQMWATVFATVPAAATYLAKKGATVPLATFFSMFLIFMAPFLKRLDNRRTHPSTANAHYGKSGVSAQGLASICLVSGVLGLGYCLITLLKT